MNPLSLTAWCAALFAASSLFSHDVALRLVLLAAGLLFAATAAVMQRRELRFPPAIWWPFLLWAAWAALSLTWSIEPGRSGKEFRNEIVYVGLGFLVCYIGAQAPRAARSILPVLAAGATLLCAVAFYAFLQGPEAYIEGWHGGPGNLSSALLALLPAAVAVGWYAARSGLRNVVLLASVVAFLILVAAYTTLNRTVWIGFAIELLLLGGLIAKSHGLRNDRRLRFATGIFAVSVIAGCALIAAHVETERVEGDPTAALEKDPRAKIWPEVLKRIEAAPLTGYGFGRGLFRQALTREFDSGLIWHAHNLFLDTALQTGIPGLLLFLLLLGAIVREGWRAFNRSNDAASAACGLALLGLVVGMAVRNMTDTLLVRQNSLFFWAAVGFLLGWIEMRRKRPAPA